MAQVTTITLTDDMTGDPADETVTFGLDGSEYEIDLSANNAGILRDILGDYVTHGRKVGKLTAVTASRARSNGNGGNRTVVDREQLRAIREWAKSQGMAVSDRGRIKAEIKQAFDAAH
jgi:nucleoid-associated protein Lsr2